MPDYFDSGLLLRTGAWHKKGNVVEEWPGSWELARQGAGLTWEVTTRNTMLSDWDGMALDEESVYLLRDDMPAVIKREDDGKLIVNPAAKLGIQNTSYAIINNAAFGELIESIVGEIGSDFQFETLISIKGGKQIIALMRSREPLRINGDFSPTFTYLAITVRHDGQGGFRVIPTNIRIVCANTAQAAEFVSRKMGVGWTIRHTVTWKERVKDLQLAVAGAVRSSEHWANIANVLLDAPVTPGQMQKFLVDQLPLSDNMTERQENSIKRAREQVRTNWQSKTCADLGPNAYRMLMGFTEYLDNDRRATSDDSRISRSLLVPDSRKVRAMRYCTQRFAKELVAA